MNAQVTNADTNGAKTMNAQEARATTQTATLAIHSEPFQCASGYTCKRWVRYWIYVGANPFGVRGGRCGSPVDARCVAGPFRSRGEAEEVAARYLRTHPDTAAA